MTKSSTVQTCNGEIFKEKRLTIGLDLGDLWSSCCVLDEAGKITLEQKLPTTLLGERAQALDAPID